MNSKVILISLFLAVSLPFLFANEPVDKMAWWKEARFGMFIHWGVYSVYGNVYDGPNVNGEIVHYDKRETGIPSEWIMNEVPIPRAVYREAAKVFDAKDYDPKEWVRIAKQAGMKYIVITAKHHDGFCLFETKHTKWNSIDASPAGRDLLKDLVKEAKDAGLKIGFYYSQNLDWMAEGAMGPVPELNGGEYPMEKVNEYVDNLVIPQIIELTSNYDIDIFWFDYPGVRNITPEIADKILNTLLSSPVGHKVIYNNRLINSIDGDFITPETHTPNIPYNGYQDDTVWEACASLMTGSWGWEYDSENPYYINNRKTGLFTINRILELTSKGGNFLLNVGPDKHGNFSERSVEVLKEVGDWMQIYGETIYGTVKNNLVNPFEYGYVTQKYEANGSVHWYLHIPPNFWTEKKIILPGVLTLPSQITVFETKENIDAVLENGNLVIILPDSYPNQFYSTIDVSFNKEPIQMPKSGLRNNSIRLTPYQAVTNDIIRKEFCPYVIKKLERKEGEIVYDIYLEKGKYIFEAEYSTWTNGCDLYFHVDDQRFGVSLQTTSTNGKVVDEMVFVKEKFNQTEFTLPESKRVKIKITRDAQIPGKTSWVSIKSIGLTKTDTTAIDNKETSTIIFPTYISEGYFILQSDPGKIYKIYGVDGKLHKEIDAKAPIVTVDVNDLRSGIYIVSGNNFEQKIIIN